MSATTNVRIRTTLLVVIAFLPTLVGLVVLRPLPALAQEATYGFFALTVEAAAQNTTGDLGAGGGLTPVDSGSPVVIGFLDSSPEAQMLAAAVEPGTLFRTAAAIANGEFGEEVIPSNQALAQYPAGPEQAVDQPAGTVEDGPFSSTGASASAVARERSIQGAAEASSQSSGTDGTSEGSRAEASAAADPGSGTLQAVAVGKAAKTTFAGGVFVVDNVLGSAQVMLVGGERTAQAGLSIGGGSVGGVPVAITDEGVIVAADAPLLPGQEASALQDQVNAQLTQAGIAVSIAQPRESVEGRSMIADSGGLVVTVSTPSSPAAPGNVVTYILGQAVVTSSDEAPRALQPLPDPGTPAPTQAPVITPTARPTQAPVFTPAPTSAPVAPTVAPTVAEAPPPVVAAPIPGDGTMLVSARRVGRRSALALFLVWQMLSLSICTLAALAFRRGRPGLTIPGVRA